jgi:hypothetical protein
MILTSFATLSLNSDFSAFHPSIGLPKAAHGHVSGSQLTARLQFQQSCSGFFFAIYSSFQAADKPRLRFIY